MLLTDKFTLFKEDCAEATVDLGGKLKILPFFKFKKKEIVKIEKYCNQNFNISKNIF